MNKVYCKNCEFYDNEDIRRYGNASVNFYEELIITSLTGVYSEYEHKCIYNKKEEYVDTSTVIEKKTGVSITIHNPLIKNAGWNCKDYKKKESCFKKVFGKSNKDESIKYKLYAYLFLGFIVVLMFAALLVLTK